ncbi:MAG TPA: V-type ATP synthase subunit D [Actinomycetota bacterium]|jgi:V/A-type H+-transporting ATPase subunit D
MAPLRTPPGRTGHLWLRERLDVARRASDVLEEKARVLAAEERRLRVLERRSRRDWEEAWDLASRWLLRSTLLGGRRGLAVARAHQAEEIDVRIRWGSTMGATYPTEAVCRPPAPPAAALFAGTSALRFAASAHAEAATAAVRHAADRRALEVVRRELSVARRRQRAIERRWIPRLESALARLELSLAEEEREDTVRATWVSERTGEGSR